MQANPFSRRVHRDKSRPSWQHQSLQSQAILYSMENTLRVHVHQVHVFFYM